MDSLYGPRYLIHPPFCNGLRIFEHIDCVHLQQQVIRLYIFEYSLIIMVIARWLMRQRTWSGQIGNLHISMVCSSLYGIEGRRGSNILLWCSVWEGVVVCLGVARGLIYGIVPQRWPERAVTIWSFGKRVCAQNAPWNRGHASVLKEWHICPACSTMALEMAAVQMQPHPVQPSSHPVQLF